jgi:HSP20 family molecular chaperone IbpA
MFENDHEIVIVVAMPGAAAERIQVVNEPGAVVVRGERRLPFAGMPLAVRQLEIPYGAFERRIPLPNGRFEAGAPELSHGCLLLHLRKIA